MTDKAVGTRNGTAEVWRSLALVLIAGFLTYMGSYFIHGHNKLSRTEIKEMFVEHSNHEHPGAASDEDVARLEETLKEMQQDVAEMKKQVDNNTIVLNRVDRAVR